MQASPKRLIATAGAAVNSNIAIIVLVVDFITLIIKIFLPSPCWIFAPPQLTTSKRYKRGNPIAKNASAFAPQNTLAAGKNWLVQNLHKNYNEKRPANCGAFSFLSRVNLRYRPTLGHTRVIHLPQVTNLIRAVDPVVHSLNIVGEHRNNHAAFVPQNLLHFKVLGLARITI